MAEWSKTWTWFDDSWHEGNVPIMGVRSHATWLASSVFDGARSFNGLMPDLDRHCSRLNQSAVNLGLKPIMRSQEIEDLAREGASRFDEAVYIRPMYWAEEGGFMSIPPDPESTRFCLCLHETPMPGPEGFSLTMSPFRRPTLETMPTNAKTGSLYPNNARAITEARSRGFDNALLRDVAGNVAETGTSNIFMVKDGTVLTPHPNGSFLSGITRQRVIDLLRDDGCEVLETTLTVADFLDADELFSTGNYSKVVPINRFEDRQLQPGPVASRARELYFDWAQTNGASH